MSSENYISARSILTNPNTFASSGDQKGANHEEVS
jgi:hypothetical protein